MNATDKCLAALRFFTNCRPVTHHCDLYSGVGRPPLSQWYVIIYKAVLGLLPIDHMEEC